MITSQSARLYMITHLALSPDSLQNFKDLAEKNVLVAELNNFAIELQEKQSIQLLSGLMHSPVLTEDNFVYEHGDLFMRPTETHPLNDLNGDTQLLFVYVGMNGGDVYNQEQIEFQNQQIVTQVDGILRVYPKFRKVAHIKSDNPAWPNAIRWMVYSLDK